jgi:hypothetical protein
MKKLFALVIFLLLCSFSSNSHALTIDVIGFGDGDWGAGNSPGILGERDDWTEVAEMENVYSDSRVTGSNYSIYDPYPTDAGWGGVMWIWGPPGYAQTQFTTPSDSLFVQFESDSNDGIANFYIDNVFVHSLNTYNGSWFAVVFSDLDFGVHTLRVNAGSSRYPYDLSIDAMGSGAPGTDPVPEPATLLLLSTGLVGLAGFGRKRLKK